MKTKKLVNHWCPECKAKLVANWYPRAEKFGYEKWCWKCHVHVDTAKRRVHEDNGFVDEDRNYVVY